MSVNGLGWVLRGSWNWYGWHRVWRSGTGIRVWGEWGEPGTVITCELWWKKREKMKYQTIFFYCTKIYSSLSLYTHPKPSNPAQSGTLSINPRPSNPSPTFHTHSMLSTSVPVHPHPLKALPTHPNQFPHIRCPPYTPKPSIPIPDFTHS